MTQKLNHYDIIIIGAGIAGLYAAYTIKKLYPEKTFLILEKNKKQAIGGRASSEYFHGSEIATGAGIGRKRSDLLLIKLMHELKFKYFEFKTVVNRSSAIKHVDIMKTIESLKSSYKKYPELKHLTFKEFFIKTLGSLAYKDFVLSTGYTDYENADIYDTLYNYTMSDIVPGWTGLHISWADLIDKLYNQIKSSHFKFSYCVTSLKKTNGLFEINTQYRANKIIVATTLSGILKIVPNAASSQSLYRQIHAQPFLRVYAKFNKEYAELLKQLISNYTILKTPLQKIIPINAEKGIYMIAYSDNKSALYLKKYILNTHLNREMFCRLLDAALGVKLKITAIRSYYWAEGTHYYEPLPDNFKNREEFLRSVQHPQENLAVVGEAVSIHQGWVEGALESVQQAITKKYIQS